MLPPLRADMKLDEDYWCSTGSRTGARLSVPCVVYGGADDLTVTREELHAWHEHFDEESAVGVETFPGGHFYTVSAQAALLDSITRHLNRVRAWASPSIAVAGTSYPATGPGIWERFSRQVELGPEKLALADGEQRWTYRELGNTVTALASDLSALGTRKGDVIGLLLPHSAEYCISLLACLGLGAPACLLEKNWPPSLLARFLKSAGVRMVVTTPELAGLLPTAFQAPDRLLVLDEVRCSAAARCTHGGRCTDAGRRGGQDSGADASLPVFAHPEPSDIALISMTSGTSGTPKAVLNTHRGCFYCFDARYDLYPYGEASCDGLNVFFGWECLRPLLQGKPAVVVPDDHIFDPVRLVDTLENSRITRIVVPPSLFESVLDHPAVGPELSDRLAHMEIVFLMGEVVPTRIVDKAARLLPPHVRLVNAYSTWESLDVSFANLLPTDGAGTPGTSSFATVGRILDGSAAIVLNEQGEPVPYGGVGELYFSSPGVAVGYLDDQEKTAERFVPCPPALAHTLFAGETFYRTGDRARLLPAGDIEILGRIGDIVKLRGFKVSLRAVENVLAEQEGVARVVVRPRLDSQTHQPTSLIAYVLGDRGKPSETVLARLRRKAGRDLPEYARPRHVIGLDQFPVSRSGSRKIDFAALPAPPEDTAQTTAPAFPLTSMEQRIAEAWREVLGVPALGPDDNFFDVGGDSLSAARLSGLLSDRLGIVLPVVEVFQHSTLRDMAGHCSGSRNGGGKAAEAAEPPRRAQRAGTTRLAVVGMAGRFPGAATVAAFWELLKNGTDSLTTFSPEQLRKKGVPEEVLAHPSWVPAAQLIDDADKFDAEFWGIGQREATLMDPQHRAFVEVAWSALEQAGYARRDNPYRRRTGVFAACGIDGYLIHHLKGGGLTDPLDPAGVFLTEIGNEKDYIATRVAYLMDLGGPAITVTSACSSALVAVAQAAQSIMSGQCDMAVAGASSLNFPNFGYRYEDGLVGSGDGHVRPFDDAASGTLFGDSVGAVVLKRLDDALEDGDHIWAVLSGYGVSNDGRRKAGYTAPSALAQAQCISDAITMAGIDSGQLSYVECHATATHIGDAIELKGLLDAFTRHGGGDRLRTGGCPIGSVKGNIGHANCAAGITGFIKTVLCLYHRALVPTVNHQNLNPKLVDFVDCEGSPFTVQQTHEEWGVADPAKQLPRRAGVSSFGIGGTNAHVILEEAPEAALQEKSAGAAEGPRAVHLVTVSARSEGAFRRNADAMARFVEGLPGEQLAAAVRSLHLTREAHPLRGSAVVIQGAGKGPDHGPATGLDALRRLAEQSPRSSLRQGRTATVAFCFPGQGSQTAFMARGLYRGRADGGRFRRHFDAACGTLGRHLPFDPAALILGADENSVMRPVTTQCGLFAVEYALARTLMDLGVVPVAVAGHSIGEYAAAVVSGVLTLEEAAMLVAVRAQATEELRPDAGAGSSDGGPGGVGGMLSVVGDEDRLADWLAGRADLWLAVENAPGRVVVAGTGAALREAAVQLPELGFSCRKVPVSHPFHSALMAPVGARLDAVAASLEARAPGVPMASNLTGAWLDSRYRPSTYWGEHVTRTVRWRNDVDTLLKWEPDIVLEVGPGHVLTTLTMKCLQHRGAAEPLTLTAMPNAVGADKDDEAGFLAAVGDLWSHGVDLDFAALHEGERASGGGRHDNRPLLPGYSFERTSYWTNPEASPYVDVSTDPSTGRGTGDVAAESGFPYADEAARQLVRFVEKQDATVRLYCLPYAGGNAGAFRSWARTAPPWLDVVAVELPGRNDQAHRAIPRNDDEDAALLERLAAAIRSDAGPAAVALCGLSLGASLALDLLGGPLADWAREGRVTAVSLVGRAPFTSRAHPEAPLDSYLMVPNELRDDVQWKENVLPLLQADLALDARAQRRAVERQQDRGTQLIDSPLQVHCGTQDPSFPSASAREWAEISASPVVEVHAHEGAHDFMLHHREAILDLLVGFLDRLAPHLASGREEGTARLHEVRWVPAEAITAPEATAGSRWIDLDESGPAASLRWLLETLTEPAARAALVCRMTAGKTPEQHCQDFLSLLQSLAQADARGHLDLVLPARDTSGLVAGMTRSFVLEEPGLTVRRVYVHDGTAARAGETPEETAVRIDRLLRRMAPHERESDILHRGGHLFAQRLLPAALPELPPGTLGTAEGSYLITGGTGGIGPTVTDWLIHHQGVAPGRVIVSGRKDPHDLRRGVRFLEMDLARPVDVHACAEGTGPLAGIVHLAGVLDDGVLRHLDASRFPAVLAPKLGLPQLTELGRTAGAPWIAVFSSTSALLGAAGQANYAAANAWMDAHAMWPPAQTAPSVVSINWGTWGEVGMAASHAKALDAARAAGETPLRSGQALHLFGKILAAMLSGGATGRNFAVCDVDWHASPWAGSPLVSVLTEPEAHTSVRGRPRQIDVPAGPADANAAAPEGGEDGVRSFLTTYVHRWDESKRLTDLGLDSLDFARMRGEFSRLFGKEVPLAAFTKPDLLLGELHAFLSAC
ncbi:beta-ketoacyl synthase N-terminal-like domain-containing protein [Streptomyces sp. NPDC002845]